MRKFNLAVWQLGIRIVQLNIRNPETGEMELRRFRDDGTWSLTENAAIEVQSANAE